MLLPLLVNIFYILFAFIYSRIIYKIVKNKLIQLLVFLIIIVLPYNDILIQKVIKSYYETFKTHPMIYEFPEKDNDGKIESLDLTDSPVNYFIQSVDKKENSFDKRIRDFLEIKISQNENTSKYVRIKFNRKSIQLDIIRNPIARYKVIIQTQERLFGLYTEIKYQLIDKQQENKVLVETIKTFFPHQKNNFRNKYLLWNIEKEDFPKIDIINDKEIIEKLLEAGHI